MKKTLILSSLLCFLFISFIAGQPLKAASQADIAYGNAYNALLNAQTTKTQKTIDTARTAIASLSGTGASWAIGEFSRQVDLIEQQLPKDTSVITNVYEFNAVLKNALENFDTHITLKIQNYNSSVFNFGNIDDVINVDPIIDYGYDGCSWKISLPSTGDITTIELNLEYTRSKAIMQKMKSDTEQKASLILSTIIKPNMTDLQKEYAIHDYIVNNSMYDIENYNIDTMPPEDFTDYGILVDGIGVCEGYAKAMFRLLNSVGVKCTYITGIAGGGPHAWNKVVINGVFYNVDATWDDPVSKDGIKILSHDYFNLTDEQMSKDHIW